MQKIENLLINHDLRSSSSTSKTMGVDIYDLRNWLGHTSVKNTEIYVNTLDEPKDDSHSLRLYDLLNS